MSQTADIKVPNDKRIETTSLKYSKQPTDTDVLMHCILLQAKLDAATKALEKISTYNLSKVHGNNDPQFKAGLSLAFNATSIIAKQALTKMKELDV